MKTPETPPSNQRETPWRGRMTVWDVRLGGETRFTIVLIPLDLVPAERGVVHHVLRSKTPQRKVRPAPPHRV